MKPVENHQFQNEKYGTELKEISAKIQLKKIEMKTDHQLRLGCVEDNKESLRTYRTDNRKIRSKLIEMTKDRDALVIQTALTKLKRDKSLGLAFRRRSIEGVKEELRESYLRLKNKHNHLCSLKNEKKDKLKSLKFELLQLEKDSKDTGGSASRRRQLENSLDKISIKTSSAHRIGALYHGMKTRLGNQVINYPVLIKELESTKLKLDKEVQQIMAAHTLANLSKETSQKERKALKEKVHAEMIDRISKLRSLRAEVHRRSNEDDHDSQLFFRLNSKMLLKKRRESEERNLRHQNRAEREQKHNENLEKIKVMEENAMLMQQKLGIPFGETEKMTRYFQNQSLHTTQLNQQLASLQSNLFEKNEYFKGLLHQLNNPSAMCSIKFDEDVKKRKNEIAVYESVIERQKVDVYERNQLLSKIRETMENIFSKIVECAGACNSQLLPQKIDSVYNGELSLPELLHVIATAVNVVDQTATRRLAKNGVVKKDQREENAMQFDMEQMLHQNNDRLCFRTMAQCYEEEFADPEYEAAADNKNYLSREKIKGETFFRRRR